TMSSRGSPPGSSHVKSFQRPLSRSCTRATHDTDRSTQPSGSLIRRNWYLARATADSFFDAEFHDRPAVHATSTRSSPASPPNPGSKPWRYAGPTSNDWPVDDVNDFAVSK